MTLTPDPDIQRFDRWASTYDRSVMQRFFFVPIQSKMLSLLMNQEFAISPDCIVDVGCGTGGLLRAASFRWLKAKVFGVDPAEHMVSEAIRLNPKATFMRASAESLPFADQTVDVVLSSLSFHHWSDQEKGVQEVARVLRSDGLFCLADHTFPLAKLTGEKLKSRTALRALMVSAGLTVLLQQSAGFPFVLVTLAQK